MNVLYTLDAWARNCPVCVQNLMVVFGFLCLSVTVLVLTLIAQERGQK